MLNENQLKAVKTTKGRILVLAGAGSGKTTVLVERIAFLINENKINPKTILGLTFTNKAAAEMRHRVAKKVGTKRASSVTLCTFHSFCLQVLREHIFHLGYTKQFSLYDEKDLKRLLSQSARDLLQQEGELPSLQEAYFLITQAKSKGVPITELTNIKNTNTTFTNKLYDALQRAMKAYNAVDFDDLLRLTCEIFTQYPEVLNHYQTQYQYIMIDEYQDTNHMQFRIADALAKKHQNLFVVGDDDQAIYTFRGAEIQHILDFQHDCAIRLEHNYRSTKSILDAANHVIQKNTLRHEKTLKPTREKGHLVQIFHAPTDQEEAQAVIDRILALKEHHSWKDMAILYRSNHLSKPFELALMNGIWKKKGNFIRGIPYQIFGGQELHQRAEVRDMISYLKTISNPNDQESLVRILNYPRRGISEATLSLLKKYTQLHSLSLFALMQNIIRAPGEFPDVSPKALQGIETFVEIIESARIKFERESLSSSLKWLVKQIDYEKTIEKEAKTEKGKEFKWENVQQCVEALKQYEENTENPSLHDFLSSTLLDQAPLHSKKSHAGEDKISLMTFHSAKGLEFPICFLVGLEDEIIPHEKCHTKEGIEEERRLFYVALTRAKNRLCLSMARKRKKRGKELSTNPSRFLYEIPKSILEVSSWKFGRLT